MIAARYLYVAPPGLDGTYGADGSRLKALGGGLLDDLFEAEPVLPIAVIATMANKLRRGQRSLRAIDRTLAVSRD